MRGGGFRLPVFFLPNGWMRLCGGALLPRWLPSQIVPAKYARMLAKSIRAADS